MDGVSVTKKLIRLIAPRYSQVNVFSRIPMPPLGLLYIGAAVESKTNWRVEIIDENNWNGKLDHAKIQKENPADIVGFYGGMTSTTPRIYELAKLYKSMGALTIAGGSHVDALPEEAITNGIDIAVRGEGEKTIIEMIDAFENGRSFENIDGVACFDANNEIRINKRREPIFDLDTLDSPNFNQIINQRIPIKWFPISRTRGCNYSCEFCTVRDQQGRARSTSPEHTFNEIVNLVNEFNARYFFITDDYFAQDRDGTVKLCDMLDEYQRKNRIKLNFIVQLRAEAARDDELVDAMQRCGVRIICIGLESPIPEDLKMMRKGQTVEGMERDVETLHDAGFYIHGMFIFGYPGDETRYPGLSIREKANLYIDFIKKTKIDTIQILKAVPIPGSKLRERLRQAGRIYPLEKVGWDKYDGSFLCFEPTHDDPLQVQLEGTRIMKVFYRPIFIWKAIGLLPLLPFDDLIQLIRNARARSLSIARSGQDAAKQRLHAGREVAGRYLEAGKVAASRHIEVGKEIASKGIQSGREAASKHIEAGREAASRVIGNRLDLSISRVSRLRRAFRNSIYRYGGSLLLRDWHRIPQLDAFMKFLKTHKTSISRN